MEEKGNGDLPGDYVNPFGNNTKIGLGTLPAHHQNCTQRGYSRDMLL